MFGFISSIQICFNLKPELICVKWVGIILLFISLPVSLSHKNLIEKNIILRTHKNNLQD
jgi:hypothetical protein